MQRVYQQHHYFLMEYNKIQHKELKNLYVLCLHFQNYLQIWINHLIQFLAKLFKHILLVDCIQLNKQVIIHHKVRFIIKGMVIKFMLLYN